MIITTIKTMIRYVSVAAGALALALLTPLLASAQEPRPAPAPANSEAAAIQALVAEVRELRLSIERSNVLMLRFQAALQANQQHSDRLKDLSGQLTVVTTQLSAATRQRAGMQDELKRAEKESNSADPEVRKEFELRLPRLKTEVESLTTQELELRARESALLGEVQRETTQMEDWRRW